MMKFIMIPCKKATFLLGKKEEGKLSFGERVRLSFHLLICRFCRLFERQTRQIGRECPHLHADEKLSLPARARLEQAIRDQYPF